MSNKFTTVIKTGILDPDHDAAEITINYAVTPEGVEVWFENGFETMQAVPLEVIKMAAERIK